MQLAYLSIIFQRGVLKNDFPIPARVVCLLSHNYFQKNLLTRLRLTYIPRNFHVIFYLPLILNHSSINFYMICRTFFFDWPFILFCMNRVVKNSELKGAHFRLFPQKVPIFVKNVRLYVVK